MLEEEWLPLISDLTVWFVEVVSNKHDINLYISGTSILYTINLKVYFWCCHVHFFLFSLDRTDSLLFFLLKCCSLFTDDDLCPVKSFIKYKKQLNPKCSRLFQRPGKGDTKWYENAPIGHNKIANMMPTISDSAGLSTRYTNHSLRATSVHILDSKQFAGTVDLNYKHLRIQKIIWGV